MKKNGCLHALLEGALILLLFLGMSGTAFYFFVFAVLNPSDAVILRSSAVSPNRLLNAYVSERLTVPPDSSLLCLTLLEADTTFNPKKGKQVTCSLSADFVDLEWEDESNLHVVIRNRGARFVDLNELPRTAFLNREITLTYEQKQIGEIKQDAFYRLGEIDAGVAVELREYGTKDEVVTFVIIDRLRGVQDYVNVLAEPVLYLKGQHRVDVQWVPERGVILRCTDAPKSDYMWSRGVWKDIPIVVELLGEESNIKTSNTK